MKKITLSLILSVGCGSDPIQDALLKKEQPVLEKMHKKNIVEKLEADLKLEEDKNREEIEEMETEMFDRHDYEYEEINSIYVLREREVMERHESTWSSEILEVRSSLMEWAEEDRNEISERVADVREECYKLMDTESEAYENIVRADGVSAAESAKDSACLVWKRQYLNVSNLVEEARREKDSLLSQDYWNLIKEFEKKQAIRNDELSNLYAEVFRELLDRQLTERRELNVQIREIKEKQRLREIELMGKIIEAEAK